MQLIKGESAYWFNNQKFILEKFQWQDEYFAISVSETSIERVRNYIKNQETHHQKKSSQQEYDKLIYELGFQKFKDEKY
jgi:REP element-mobilizing transposase RayT